MRHSTISRPERQEGNLELTHSARDAISGALRASAAPGVNCDDCGKALDVGYILSHRRSCIVCDPEFGDPRLANQPSTAAPGGGMDARGTLECPICEVAEPHPHSTADIQHWLNIQAGRFGNYIVRVFHPNNPENAYDHSTLDLLIDESRQELAAYGHVLESTYRAIELIEKLSSELASLRPSPAPAGVVTLGGQHSVAPPAPAETERGGDTRHYMGTIRLRLEQLYNASPDNPELRELISDEVDWVDAQLSAALPERGDVRAQTIEECAKVADSYYNLAKKLDDQFCDADDFRSIARAIRALSQPAQEGRSSKENVETLK
jgi:hypothetical protein